MVAAAGLLVTVPLAGVSVFTASGLLGICSPPASWTLNGRAPGVVVPAAVALTAWCAALPLVPSPVEDRVAAHR